jgi:hypothetical protein
LKDAYKLFLRQALAVNLVQEGVGLHSSR